MSKPKHTPGPWTARKAPERNAYAWDVEGAQGTVPTIARMALVDRVSEVEGNAHLIAAAPAMYEALLQTSEVIEAIEDYQVFEDLQNVLITINKTLAQAEAKS